MNHNTTIHKKSYAKINLGLDVTGVRKDGYHRVHMIMQSISLADEVSITKTKRKGISLYTNLSYLPTDQRNIAHRAVRILDEDFNFLTCGGVEIHIQKNIPVAAGLAGGSSNAAAVLLGINELFQLGLTTDELCGYGLRLGADVPYCILLGTKLAEGIGEKLSELPCMPECTILIAKPPSPVSTKKVYEQLDELALDGWDKLEHPDNQSLISGLEKQDILLIAESMGNILEKVTVPIHPEIQTIKDLMLKHGALGAMMSGSGPTVFGIYRDLKLAESAIREIEEKHLSQQVYVTVPIKG